MGLVMSFFMNCGVASCLFDNYEKTSVLSLGRAKLKACLNILNINIITFIFKTIILSMYTLVDAIFSLGGLVFFVLCLVGVEPLKPVYSPIAVGWWFIYPIIN